jgi:hypothetical protein
MAIPILAIVQAVATLSPLFKKNSQTEKAQAKVLLKDNNASVSSRAGMAAVIAAGGVYAATPPESLEGLITALVLAAFGVFSYFYPQAGK